MSEIREFGSYAEMQSTHQKEVNEFPFIWCFAFSDTEFIKKMAIEIQKRKPSCTGITTMQGIAKHVTSIGAGGFVFKEDVDKMNEMFDKHKEERIKFNENINHLVDCIYTEMCNHEYGYTHDPHDTLIACGKGYYDLENDPLFNEAWAKAQRKCFADYDEWNQQEVE